MDTSERISRGFDRLGHVASPALSFVKLVLAGVVLTMILTSAAAAGPLEDGVAAYLRGDFAAALQLIRPLAEQGLADAQFYLGSMYGDGKGVPQDHAEAAKWYRLAAEQGDADAQVVLGSIYNEGEGVPQDYAEAVKWFRLAAEQGYANAQYNLGVSYDRGEGVPQDHAQAVKWYRLAAEQEYAGAQNALNQLQSD